VTVRHNIQMPPAPAGGRAARRLTDECGKRRYATREAAEDMLRHLQMCDENHDALARVYECGHGWWHLTSKENWDA
jgi:hypothetical protein